MINATGGAWEHFIVLVARVIRMISGGKEQRGPAHSPDHRVLVKECMERADLRSLAVPLPHLETLHRKFFHSISDILIDPPQ